VKNKLPPKTQAKAARVVFFFDVDNTLLDNDRVVEDVRTFLRREVGAQRCGRYWRIFEDLRQHLGYADYLGALQRYRREYPHDLHLLKISRFLIHYPFADRLFPKALSAIRHVQRWGKTALLSDGDVVFQPHKIEQAGLDTAVQGRVLIYVHKQKELADVAARLPAKHYVMFDDKLHVLAGMKRIWRNHVTTVFVRQGHYAHDRRILSRNPPADLAIDRIAQVLDYDLEDFLRMDARKPGH
jgi:FMN phosphatase YigB (HAD superfamily)